MSFETSADTKLHPIEQQSIFDLTQILGNGLAVGVDAFGKSLQQDSSVQATERLATDIGKAMVRNAEQERQDDYDVFHDPVKLRMRKFAHASLGVVGVAQGIFNFETQLSQQFSQGFTEIKQNPQAALAKAGAGIGDIVGMAAKVNLDIYNGNFKGLGDDYNAVEKFAKETANDFLNGTDYLVNANPLQQGEVIGHYLMPALAAEEAGKFASGKVLGAAKHFAAAGEAGEGTGVVENSRNLVGKVLEAQEMTVAIDEVAAKNLFGKHHETISAIQKNVDHVEKPMHHVIEGGHHAERAGEAAQEQNVGDNNKSKRSRGA